MELKYRKIFNPTRGLNTFNRTAYGIEMEILEGRQGLQDYF